LILLRKTRNDDDKDDDSIIDNELNAYKLRSPAVKMFAEIIYTISKKMMRSTDSPSRPSTAAILSKT